MLDVLMLFDYFPKNLRNIAYRMPHSFRERGEELRIRTNRPLKAHMDGRTFCVNTDGSFSENGGFCVPHELVKECFDRFTEMSPYAFADELSNGYVTVGGGHRIGFCGKKYADTMRDISSVNVRIAREVCGASEGCAVLPLCNMLVISPPGAGKTTFLRDAARRISDSGIRVCVVDERCEIGAVFHGVPQHDVGENTDILSGFSLAEGIIKVIRTMRPELIVTDEIGGEEDEAAIAAALKSGVKILASAHGDDKNDVFRRLGKISGVFEKVVAIENVCGVRSARFV